MHLWPADGGFHLANGCARDRGVAVAHGAARRRLRCGPEPEACVWCGCAVTRLCLCGAVASSVASVGGLWHVFSRVALRAAAQRCHAAASARCARGCAVGNIGFDVTRDDLMAIFSEVGTVVDLM